MKINNATNSENQTCRRCGSIDLITKPRVFSNGTTHLETRCDRGHFIEFSWQGKPLEVMPFGKHKGRRIRDLPRDYLRWLLTRADISRSLRRAIEILTGEVGAVLGAV